MESTVKQRLISFIGYKGITKNQFEKECGLSTGYVANISKSIQPDKTARIAEKFPDLNTGWLLTGEGEMLRTSPQTVSQQGDSSTIVTGNGNVGNGNGNRVDSSSEALNKALDALASSQRMHETTQAQLGRFQEQTAKFQEQIDHLIALLERPRK